jgi:SAM-dependent methyltransferase
MMASLRRRKRALDDWLAARGLSHTVSLPSYLLHRELEPLLEKECRGSVLDAGSGRSPYRAILEGAGCRVTSVDIEDRSGRLDVVADIQEMPHVASDSFDGVVCTQVLEHVPRPWRAVAELARVLRPGGLLILSAPHLSAVHEAPNDYCRFTRYALQSMASVNGLQVQRIGEVGGFVAFASHGVTAAWLAIVAGIPGLARPAWWLNFVLVAAVLRPLDRLVGFRSVYPCNLLMVARKLETDT